MNYKILISIGLSNLLSVAYALDNITAPHSILPPAAIKSSINISHGQEGSKPDDMYQYCFRNLTWVVPPQTLLAYLYDNANLTPVSDQTVWVFSAYNQGYFAGQSYTAINNSTLSLRYLIGSVTSEGKVFITFYSGTSTNTDLVSGIGNLNVTSSGQCTFIMQMNSGQNGVSGLTHWSYMVPVNPGDAFYNNLPGTQMSVPQFLAQF